MYVLEGNKFAIELQPSGSGFAMARDLRAMHELSPPSGVNPVFSVSLACFTLRSFGGAFCITAYHGDPSCADQFGDAERTHTVDESLNLAFAS